MGLGFGIRLGLGSFFHQNIVPAPTISAVVVTSIGVDSGDTDGGYEATITGTNFDGSAAFDFGANAATGIVVVNATTATCTVPATTSGFGRVDVVVTTDGGTDTLTDGFNYWSATDGAANCEIWLRADTGITIDTGVGTWVPIVGASDAARTLEQTTGSKQPTLNATDAAYGNKPTLSFAALSSQHLLPVGNNNWFPGPATVGTFYVVGEFGTALQIMMSWTNSPVGEFYNNTGDDLRYYQDADLQAVGEGDLQTPAIYCVVCNGASSKIYKSAKTALVTGDAGSGALSRLNLGCASSAGTLTLDGKVEQVFRYSGAHDNTTVGQILDQLSLRTGIALGA